jgi:hypothetical protein
MEIYEAITKKSRAAFDRDSHSPRCPDANGDWQGAQRCRQENGSEGPAKTSGAGHAAKKAKAA